jgi:hypothetical protein
MKRIFLTSALFLSLLSFGQEFNFGHNIETFVTEYRAWEDKTEKEDSAGACDVFKKREVKEKADCEQYWTNRRHIITTSRMKEDVDIRTYFQNKEILLNVIKLAHDNILRNPKVKAQYTDEVKRRLKVYRDHAATCAYFYEWDEFISVINIEDDPKTVFKVTIKNYGKKLGNGSQR